MPAAPVHFMRVLAYRPPKERVILFLDSGFASFGLAAYSFRLKKFVCLDGISTKAENKKRHIYVSDDNARRCKEIAAWLRTITGLFDCCAVFAELPSGGARGAKPLAAMSMATAITACVCELLDLPLFSVSPTECKRVVGNGSISKEATQRFVLKRHGDLQTRKSICLSQHPLLEHIADAMVILNVVEKNYRDLAHQLYGLKLLH